MNNMIPKKTMFLVLPISLVEETKDRQEAKCNRVEETKDRQEAKCNGSH
jgi:hypothetical protein